MCEIAGGDPRYGGEPSSVLCDDLKGWDWVVGGRPQREGIYVYIQLTHFFVQKKLTTL